ncbi:hypothetical protein D9M72_561850 [compost metagenome]
MVGNQTGHTRRKRDGVDLVEDGNSGVILGTVRHAVHEAIRTKGIGHCVSFAEEFGVPNQMCVRYPFLHKG